MLLTIVFVSIVPAAGAAPIVPAYESLPGAHAKIYLDFGGTDNFGTWNGRTVGAVPAYDVDNNPNSFNATELLNIREIFLRVAEKYSPFNVNVTTVDPGNRTNKETAHLMIGGDGAWYGSVVGGVALRNGFTTSSSNTAWVFPKNLGGGNPKFVAEATAHEAGHLFGLTHQSRWTQDATGKWVEQEYSTNGNDPHRRPVMGSSYGSTRGLWWHGTTTSATTMQDDLALLSRSTNGFGYRPDDHGDTADLATPLTADITGRVNAPGIISTNTDADLFSFTTGAGTVGFWLQLAPHGTMLDATLRLFTTDGTLLKSAETSSLAEALSATLAAGQYLLGVSGAGGYGDLGQYTLLGQVIPVVPEPALAGVAGAGLAVLLLRRRERTR